MAVSLGMKVNKAKSLFFDRPRVIAATDRAKRRTLGRAGGYVRLVAQRSIRKRTGVSRPGNPPHSHAPHLLRKLIFYVWDQRRDGVVIGPAKLNSTLYDDALEMLEYGGATKRRLLVINRAADGDSYVDASGRLRGKGGKFLGGPAVQFRHSDKAPLVTTRYRARPFMGPALEKSRSKIAEFWKDSIR